MDIATISRIETGRMAGTLESHMKLARGLGAKLTQVYSGIEEAQARESISVQDQVERPEASVFHTGRVATQLLTKDVLKKKFMPSMITIETGGSTQKEELRLGTEKFLYVVDGSIDVVLGEETHHLIRGSTIYFEASLPHQYRNPSGKTARILAITTPPSL